MTQPPLADQPLTDRDVQILVFERLWWHHAGHKVNEIWTRFGKGEYEYWLEVSRLIDRPEAEAHDP